MLSALNSLVPVHLLVILLCHASALWRPAGLAWLLEKNQHRLGSINLLRCIEKHVPQSSPETSWRYSSSNTSQHRDGCEEEIWRNVHGDDWWLNCCLWRVWFVLNSKMQSQDAVQKSVQEFTRKWWSWLKERERRKKRGNEVQWFYRKAALSNVHTSCPTYYLLWEEMPLTDFIPLRQWLTRAHSCSISQSEGNSHLKFCDWESRALKVISHSILECASKRASYFHFKIHEWCQIGKRGSQRIHVIMKGFQLQSLTCQPKNPSMARTIREEPKLIDNHKNSFHKSCHTSHAVEHV